MRNEDKLPANFGFGLTIGIIAFLLSFIGIASVLWQIPYPAQLTHLKEHLQYWVALRLNEFAPPLFQSTADDYRHYLSTLTFDSSLLLWRFNTAFFIAAMTGCYLGYLTSQPQSAIKHVAGRQLWRGRIGNKKITKIAASECEKHGQGIALHSSFEWKISRGRETRHFLLIGSSGSGKTQIIIPLIRAAMLRNDRVIIYDNKGDYIQWLPKPILIAPCDARGSAWDIARDCRNAQDARELATQVIPPGHEPMWHQAARQLLTAIIMKLQDEMNVGWGWQELFNLVNSDEKTLLSIVEKYVPEAIHTVTAPGKTTQSILINFGAHMSLIADLAKAWGSLPANRRFSIVEWLRNAKTANRIVVLQGNGHYAELTKAYIQGMLSMATGFINSPEFPDSNGRRIWFFLDEFPQLGDLRQAIPLLEIGRSKGIRVVLSMQDVNQIKEIYGEHVAATWMSLVGTKIITQMQAGPTANMVAKEIIGYRKIDRVVIHNGKRQAPIREDVLVMEPSELESELGPDARGNAALVIGMGDAYLLHWPLSRTEDKDKIRKSFVPAKWLKSNMLTGVPESVSNAKAASSVTLTATSDRSAKIVLHALTQNQLLTIAGTGTPIADSAESFQALTNDSAGGNHESR